MKNLIFFLIAFLSYACSSKVYNGIKWHDNTANIDGRITEWEIPLQYFDRTSQLNFQFFNDNKNLYFVARTFDEYTMQQILFSGLRLEIDTCAKSKQFPFSLAFPVMGIVKMEGMNGPPGNFMPPKEEMSQVEEDGNFGSEQINHVMNEASGYDIRRENKQRKNDFNKNDYSEIQLGEIELFGFNKLWEEEVLSFSETNGIKAQLTVDSALYFEAVIPFETFLKKELEQKDTLTVLSMKISLENIDRPTTAGAGEERPGGPPGEGGERPGGGMGAGMGGGPPGGGGPGRSPGGAMRGSPNGMSQDSNKEEKCEINLKLHLSYKKV